MMPYIAQTNYTAVKRPINQSEIGRLAGNFNMLRRASLFVGALAMVFALLALFMPATELMILSLVFGVIGIGVGIQVAQMRRKGTAALRRGEVTEITGYPSRSSFGGRMPGWAIGPITVADRKLPLFEQGRLATVACIPDIRLVLSVNGNAVPGVVQMTGPKNVEPTQGALQQQPAFPAQPAMPQQQLPYPPQQQMFPPPQAVPQQQPVYAPQQIVPQQPAYPAQQAFPQQQPAYPAQQAFPQQQPAYPPQQPVPPQQAVYPPGPQAQYPMQPPAQPMPQPYPPMQNQPAPPAQYQPPAQQPIAPQPYPQQQAPQYPAQEPAK
jgi:xanthosine utilization system XapX-like protein